MNTIIPFPQDLKTLTSLRFFAALATLIFHLRYFLPQGIDGHGGLMSKGYLGVDFFFILSGFILTHVYGASLHDKKVSIGDFLVRRLARIYPLHILMLVVMLLLALTPLRFGPTVDWPGHIPFDSFIMHVALLHAWGMERDLFFNWPSWSISAEWFAYLLFPLFIILFSRHRITMLHVLAAYGIFAAAWCYSYTIDPSRPLTRLTWDLGILRILPEFLLGVLVYRAAALSRPISQAGLWLFISAVILAALIYLEAFDFLLVGLLLLMVRLAADMMRAGSGGWLARPRVIWLGEISYAIYMVQAPVMMIVLQGGSKLLGPESYAALYPLLLTLTLALILGISAALYAGIERPTRHWITEKYGSRQQGKKT